MELSESFPKKLLRLWGLSSSFTIVKSANHTRWRPNKMKKNINFFGRSVNSCLSRAGFRFPEKKTQVGQLHQQTVLLDWRFAFNLRVTSKEIKTFEGTANGICFFCLNFKDDQNLWSPCFSRISQTIFVLLHSTFEFDLFFHFPLVFVCSERSQGNPTREQRRKTSRVIVKGCWQDAD